MQRELTTLSNVRFAPVLCT